MFNKANFNGKFNPEDILLDYKFYNPNFIAINKIIFMNSFSNSRKAIELKTADLISRIKTVYKEQVIVAYLECNGGKYGVY